MAAPTPAPVVRELRWTDFEAITEGYYGAYDERDAGEPVGIHLFDERPTWAAEAEWFAGLWQRVQSGATIARVADNGGVAVGLGELTRNGPGPSSELAHVGTLGIYLRKSHRGRGYGRALLRELLAIAPSRFSVLTLMVLATNPRAERLYEEFGFVRVGVIPRQVRRGTGFIDGVQMARLL